MNTTYRCPSKTFLVGEYLALSGGPAIVATNEPYFSLQIQPSDKTAIIAIHPESPAGRYFANHDWPNAQYIFKDPHQGLGGYGASTAQFLLLYQAQTGITQFNDDALKTLLNEYIHYAWNGLGYKPSGYDIIAQAVGDIALIQSSPWSVYHQPWPFKHLSFELRRTGYKLATHHHLQDLQAIHTEGFKTVAQRASDAFLQVNETSFIQAIQDYEQELNLQGFVCAHTQRMLSEIKQDSSVLAAKGCGAMGADIILILRES